MGDAGSIWEECWSTKGRDSSTRYAIWLGIGFVLNLLASIPLIGVLFWLASLWLLWTALVRRGHDMGRSAWFTLGLSILPSMAAAVMGVAAFTALLVGSTGWFLCLLTAAGVAIAVAFAASLWYLCSNGEPGDNEWGEDPRTPTAIAADPLRRRDATTGRIVAGCLGAFTVMCGLGVVLFAMLLGAPW